MTLLSIPTLLAKFREGTCNGGWLMKSELVLQNKMGAALGQTSSSNKVKQMRIRHDIFCIPGFQMFNWLMPNFPIFLGHSQNTIMSITFVSF